MVLYEIHRDILVQKDFSPVTPGFQSVTKYFTIILVHYITDVNFEICPFQMEV